MKYGIGFVLLAGWMVVCLRVPDDGRAADYAATSDEFGVITFKGDAAKTYKMGDRIEMIVPHCDPVVNLYDVMYGIRKDRVEKIIPITARGKSQ